MKTEERKNRLQEREKGVWGKQQQCKNLNNLNLQNINLYMVFSFVLSFILYKLLHMKQKETKGSMSKSSGGFFPFENA